MPRRFPAVVLSLLALAAVPAGAQQRLTCASPLQAAKHWDRLGVLLARKDPGGRLAVTGPATLIPVRGLERLGTDDFRAEQAVAVLDLSADQGALPRGRYCMTAQFTGTDAGALGAWSMRYYAVTAGRVRRRRPRRRRAGSPTGWWTPTTATRSGRGRPRGCTSSGGARARRRCRSVARWCDACRTCPRRRGRRSSTSSLRCGTAAAMGAAVRVSTSDSRASS